MNEDIKDAPAEDLADVIVAPVPRSKEDIDALKKNWENDSCWDIWNTEGFEAHIDELKAYQQEMEALWAKQRKTQYEKKLNDFSELGLHKKFTIDSSTSVMRVVGGWIYTFTSEAKAYESEPSSVAISSVFVPKSDAAELRQMIKELIETY